MSDEHKAPDVGHTKPPKPARLADLYEDSPFDTRTESVTHLQDYDDRQAQIDGLRPVGDSFSLRYHNIADHAQRTYGIPQPVLSDAPDMAPGWNKVVHPVAGVVLFYWNEVTGEVVETPKGKRYRQ